MSTPETARISNKEKNPLFLTGFDPQTVQPVAAFILLLTRLSLVLLHPTRCKYMYLSPGIMRTGRDANHFLLLLKTKDRSYTRWPKWQSLPFTLITCVCLRAMLFWVLTQVYFSRRKYVLHNRTDCAHLYGSTANFFNTCAVRCNSVHFRPYYAR
jgi:hypothetical protein